jgi:hypothetical protein
MQRHVAEGALAVDCCTVTHRCTVLTPLTPNLVRGGVSGAICCCKVYLVDSEFEVLIFEVAVWVFFLVGLGVGEVVFLW